MTNKDRQSEEYERLFPDDRSKAEAFDEIAKRFYCGNFGQMSKSDLETLMFHLYLERLLAESDDFKHYSDYTHSKQIGIIQSSEFCKQHYKRN